MVKAVCSLWQGYKYFRYMLIKLCHRPQSEAERENDSGNKAEPSAGEWMKMFSSLLG